jgi:hypothetical protein
MVISPEAEPALRDLGVRSDIIKTMHWALTGRGQDRGIADYVVDADTASSPIIGRLDATGLHDELTGQAYAVIDGVDGRAHHVRFPRDRWLCRRAAGGRHRRGAAVRRASDRVSARSASTSTVPIVFSTGVDPVRTGPLNRPGGNLTGFTLLEIVSGKLQLAREVAPDAGILSPPKTSKRCSSRSKPIRSRVACCGLEPQFTTRMRCASLSAT